MAIFDSILDVLKPLDDVLGKAGNILDSPLGTIAKKGLLGISDVNAAQRARAENARGQLQDRLIGGGVNVEAGRAKWGVENFAGDPASTERYWQSVLSTFLTPNATKGPR